MSVGIVEITPAEIIGVNRSAIEDHNQESPGSNQVHLLRDAGGLDTCVNAIFYQSANGYQHLPLENGRSSYAQDETRLMFSRFW